MGGWVSIGIDMGMDIKEKKTDALAFEQKTKTTHTREGRDEDDS